MSTPRAARCWRRTHRPELDDQESVSAALQRRLQLLLARHGRHAVLDEAAHLASAAHAPRARHPPGARESAGRGCCSGRGSCTKRAAQVGGANQPICCSPSYAALADQALHDGGGGAAAAEQQGEAAAGGGKVRLLLDKRAVRRFAAVERGLSAVFARAEG